jgi:hypothetical protein
VCFLVLLGATLVGCGDNLPYTHIDFNRYTNCPPPSNGQLGPFQGTAGQVIHDDSDERSYQNLLKVPPNDWLTATLDGIWDEWDGKLLLGSPSFSSDVMISETEEGHDIVNTRLNKERDWGANHWKVTFQRLRIGLFGITIFEKTFPFGTARVWRTTYLDDEIRIVRAGKTGRIADEVAFYTKRKPIQR